MRYAAMVVSLGCTLVFGVLIIASDLFIIPFVNIVMVFVLECRSTGGKTY